MASAVVAWLAGGTEATAFVSPSPALRGAGPAGRDSAEQRLREPGASTSHTVALAAAAAGACLAAGRATSTKRAAWRTAVQRRARGGGVLTKDSEGRERFVTDDSGAEAVQKAAQPQTQAAPPQGATPRKGCNDPFDASKSAVGITAPLGFWDPMKLSMKRGDGAEYVWKSEDEFYNLQEAEIKHGRVAMLATAGLLATSLGRFPGFGDVPAGFAALDTKAGGGLGIILIAAGFLELTYRASDDKEPGNLGDPAGLLGNASAMGDEQYLSYSIDMRNREINHGRLGMSSFITSVLVEYQTGMGPGEQLSYLGSHGGVALLGLLLVAFCQTPELTEEEVEKIKANMSGVVTAEMIKK